MAEGEDRGFTVVDKRASAGGEPVADSPSPEHPTDLPPADFATFCLSLATSALYHLGVVGDPETGQTVSVPDLGLARQTIDTLEMLETKTRGNLDDEEGKLLESLLYELRMRFVEAGRAAAPTPEGSEG